MAHDLTPNSSETLRRRARELAARRLEDDDRQSLGVHVLVSRGSMRLGIPIDRCDEVRRVDVFLVPGCSGVIAGIFQVRARAIGLVDLAAIDGTDDPIEHGASTLATVLSGHQGGLGMLIDSVDDVREVLHEEIDLEMATDGHGFVGAVTRDLIQLIDVDALLASPLVRSS